MAKMKISHTHKIKQVPKQIFKFIFQIKEIKFRKIYN